MLSLGSETSSSCEVLVRHNLTCCQKSAALQRLSDMVKGLPKDSLQVSGLVCSWARTGLQGVFWYRLLALITVSHAAQFCDLLRVIFKSFPG